MKTSSILATIAQVIAALPLDVSSIAITQQGDDNQQYSVVLMVRPVKKGQDDIQLEDLGDLIDDIVLEQDERIAVVGRVDEVVASLTQAVAPSLPQEVVAILEGDAHHKIEAIKTYRQLTSCSLREAKEAVDAYIRYADMRKHMHIGEEQGVRVVHVEQQLMPPINGANVSLHFAEEEGLL